MDSGPAEKVDDLSVINAAIAQRAEALGLSPRALAEVLEVRTQTVYKWLNGEITPPIGRWRAIEDALQFLPGHFAQLAGLLGNNGAQQECRSPSVLAAIDDDPTLSPKDRKIVSTLYLMLSAGSAS